MARHYSLSFPRPSRLWWPVWRRNALVWKKLAWTSVLGNLADPLIYMLGLGYGLGALLPAVDGVPYIIFLAAGTVCASTMNTATFEALYSAFSRMHVQKTWEAILNTPARLDDVLFGELLWAATKSLLSGSAILLVLLALGLIGSPLALWVLPVIVLTGLVFAALGLIVNALAPSYDFFMYYFTLLVTPMLLLSGVFFPTSQLPPALQAVAGGLPLAHAVALARPLLQGQWPADSGTHLLALLATGTAAFWIATVLTRRRLLR
ncbi:ABC transporter permease [Azospira restricta]|uniref:Transport permease protein n=1 Tax=Azospira restricta TaxID=404405 RepID=A0A974Y447_9RHOO|nr:ABC transporter permease [Azospira restricta]QRJ64280.1 ABC transporter permease [Azospira restricta]